MDSRQGSHVWPRLAKPWREAEVGRIRHDNGARTDVGELIEDCGEIAHRLLDAPTCQCRCIRGICGRAQNDVLQIIRTPEKDEESVWIGRWSTIDIRLDLIENAKGRAERLSIRSRAAEGSISSAR